jgi:hypothetical protein
LDPWTVNTLSLLGGLSAAYFVTAAVASAIGFAGIVKVSTPLPCFSFRVILRSNLSTFRFAGRTIIRSVLSRFFRRRLRVLHHLDTVRDIRLPQLLHRPLPNL